MRQTRIWSASLAALVCSSVPLTAQAAPSQPGSLVNPLNPPSACEFCHQFPNANIDFDEPAYAPLLSWQGSMMANSARDPVFWAGIAVANADVEGGTELCVRCHAPTAFLDGVGAATSIDDLTLSQQHGVECEACHRMMDDGETPAGNAQYTIDDVIVGAEVPRRGPWNFTDGNPEPPHSWIQDPFTGSSRLCGTCHDVTTPVERVDDAGVGMGFDFNEQRTYSEWLNSAYADGGSDPQSCQSCHMPEVQDIAACTEHQNQYSHPTGGRRHDLVGANRFMVEMLKQQLGPEGSNQIAPIYFDFTLERMDEFMPTAASLDITAPEQADLTQAFGAVDVTVTNNTGHKLPSGYSEGRIMWIEVVGRYQDQVVFSSGLWDQAQGMQQDEQLHTYEAHGEQLSTGTTFHLLLNDHWALDNRIPPKGLTPDVETDPVGDRYTLQQDGTWPHFDSTSYSFDAAPDFYDLTPDDAKDDVLELSVRVLYVINTREYIEFLGDNGGNAGIEVAEMFEAAGWATPVTLAEDTLSIPISAFGTEPPATDETGSETATTTETSESADTADTADDATGESTTESSSASEEVGTGADDGGKGGGCDCDATRGGGHSWAFFLPALLWWRRRRAA